MAAFCQHFHVHFRDLELLRLALTHRSYLSVTGRGDRESNERLEFLGDSVLGLVTSEHLFRTNPTEHEGQLTKTKSLLVSKAILARRALKMGLGRFVFMSHSEIESGGRQRLSILADAFESVIGAVYLDQGFEAARGFIHDNLLRDAREIAADKRHTNYKSHLQEYVQSTYRTHPVYRIRREVGPDHSKQFVVDVMVGRRVLGSGRGQNKKDAEQAAAADALDQVTSRRSPGESRSEGATESRRGRAESRPQPSSTPEVERTVARTETAPRVRETRGEERGRRAEVLPEAEPEVERKPVARRVPVGPTRIEAARLAARSAPAAEDLTGAEPTHDLPDRYEDMDDEIGRPEGPLEERRVDPFGLEDEEAPGGPRPDLSAGRSPDQGRSVVSPLRRMRSTPEDTHPDTPSESEPPSPPSPGRGPGGPSQRYGRRPGRKR